MPSELDDDHGDDNYPMLQISFSIQGLTPDEVSAYDAAINDTLAGFSITADGSGTAIFSMIRDHDADLTSLTDDAKLLLLSALLELALPESHIFIDYPDTNNEGN